MANSVKSLKDKQYVHNPIDAATPRLLPRQTAASLARAARIASNRPPAAAPRARPIRPPPPPHKTKPQEQTLEAKEDNTCSQNDDEIHLELTQHNPELTDNPEETNETTGCEVFVIDTSHVIAAEDPQLECEIYLDNVLNKTASEREDAHEQSRPDDHIDDSQASMRTRSECNQLCSDTMSLQSQPQTPKSTPRQVKRGTSRLPVTKFYSSSTLLTSTQTNVPTVVKPQTRSRTPNPTTKAIRNTTARPGSATASRNSKSVIPIQQPVNRTVALKVAPEKVATVPITPKKDDKKSIFTSKQIEFNQLKKDLDFRQQEVLKLFTNLKELEEQVSLEAPDDFVLRPAVDLQILNVADWTTTELHLLYRDAAAEANIEGALKMIENVQNEDEFEMGDLKTNALKIPTAFAEFCLKALSTRQELVDWLKDLLSSMDESSQDASRLAKYNSIGYQLCEDLQYLKEKADDTIQSMIEQSGKSYQQRRILLAVGETLVREVAKLKHEVDKHSDQLNEMRMSQIEPSTKEKAAKSPAASQPAAAAAAAADPALRQSRARVQKLEKQLRDAEIANSSLVNNARSQEEQSRQREVHFEARLRKLKEALKTSENANINLGRERDSLQEQVRELSENFATFSKSHQSEVESLTTQIKELSKALDGFREQLKIELEAKERLQESLTSAEHQVRELSIKVSHFESSTHNSDLLTEREINLRAELQVTTEALHVAEEEVNVCRQERVRFLETFTKISENDSVNSVSSMQQKLASELATKEETVYQLQCNLRKLKKAKEFNEKKVIQYEQYVKELQQHTRAVISGKDNPNLLSYQELQEQVVTLRMGLVSAEARREELADELAQRELQLEQQEKAVRAQAKTLKIREELINMLKNKETEQSRELTELQVDLEKRLKIVEEVNQQIAAKADEIKQLFVTLGSKQQQIHRLEKIVVALEEQQKRAHAQRTRHEEKIAALEHELAAAQQRERKFLFF